MRMSKSVYSEYSSGASLRKAEEGTGEGIGGVLLEEPLDPPGGKSILEAEPWWAVNEIDDDS